MDLDPLDVYNIDDLAQDPIDHPFAGAHFSNFGYTRLLGTIVAGVPRQ